ncbi:MAG TPA: DUF6599 family protein [Terracidiphilus sp.]|nr:DUF6599 family protein [Terracidiphilus sp.]
MRSIAILVCLAALVAGSAPSQSKPAPTKAAHPKSAHPGPTTIDVPVPPAVKARAMLPTLFDGWTTSKPAQVLLDPAAADSSHAAALKEYDFAFGALATYKRDGETLTLRALRFQDATGAYGAYTLFRPNGWAREDIGAGAASDHNHVVFWKGDTVVQADFSHVGPMSASEMRDLARQLPEARGNRAIAPPVLTFLPQNSLEKQTTHYALGPAGYAGSGGVLPPEIVGFDRDAEAVTANYTLQSGPATLTLIEYPTPQLAIAQAARIRDYIKAGSKAQPPFPKPLVDSDQASLEVRRSGLLVILVSGDAIPTESHRLLETVHFEENLVSIPQPMESEIAKTSRLLVGIAGIVVIGSFAAILLGFFLGGGRALYRIARGKPASSVYESEFIRLNLEK